MSRAKPPRRTDGAPPARQRGSLMVGLIIGLLIGLGVALVVALYVTKAPVPFVNKVPGRTAEQDAAEAARNRDWDPNAPLAGRNPAVPRMPASEPAVPATPTASQPDPAAILAGQSGAASAAPAAAAASPTAQPASSPAVQFYVQAGAFTIPADAEARRASVALLGMSGRVSAREQNGRTVHRVRIGPFDDRAQAEDVQDRLTGSGIESNLVRVER